MPDAPSTRLSLLVRLRDPRDGEAWRQFVHLYAPLVYRFGRRKGLQDADAADLTQDVLRAVHVGVGKFDYDVARGTFRGWLFTVAHRKFADLLARRNRPGQGSGDTGAQALLDAQPAPEEQSQWEQDFEQRLFAWAAEQVRPLVSEKTWQAFWLTAVEGKSGQEAAQQLEMTLAAVYLAKSRVMVRLKEQVRAAQEE